MVFSYNWLQSFFKKKLPPPEKLAGLLTMHSFEVVEVGKSGKDWFLDIDVLPNRAGDCFSHKGIAREIAVVTDLDLKEPGSKIKKGGGRTKDSISVEVKEKKACPRYSVWIVKGIKVGSSPAWMKERLQTCGLRPINNIVDSANYAMLETGQPLHAFDLDKISGKIIVRFARKGEKMVSLDGIEYELNPGVLVIADSKGPVAVAGIKGGQGPEVEKMTESIVLESADFDPKTIRKGSKELGLKTDASFRFEHGVDPGLQLKALERTIDLIQQTAGGKAALAPLDSSFRKIREVKLSLDLGYAESLLGISFSLKEAVKILSKLGFKVKAGKKKFLSVSVSTGRFDVSIPEDLIEELGRVKGYEKIPAVFPFSALIPPERNIDFFWENRAKDVLKEAGFSEACSYSFISEKLVSAFKYRKISELENPVSAEYKYLRPSLIPSLLKSVSFNSRRFDRIEMFEMGKVFTGTGKEQKRLTGLILGGDFRRSKGTVDLLLNKLGISDVWYNDYRATPESRDSVVWHPKKSAEIKIGGKEVGFLGEVSLEIMQAMGISGKVAIFDFDFDLLSKLCSEEHEYLPLSKYPSSVRDLALLVPGKTKVVEVLNVINQAGGILVRDVDLFDVYEGQELPEGKKNFAFHIVYQSEDKTLNSKEVDEIHNKIISVLEENPEWQVRK